MLNVISDQLAFEDKMIDPAGQLAARLRCTDFRDGHPPFLQAIDRAYDIDFLSFPASPIHGALRPQTAMGAGQREVDLEAAAIQSMTRQGQVRIWTQTVGKETGACGCGELGVGLDAGAIPAPGRIHNKRGVCARFRHKAQLGRRQDAVCICPERKRLVRRKSEIAGERAARRLNAYGFKRDSVLQPNNEPRGQTISRMQTALGREGAFGFAISIDGKPAGNVPGPRPKAELRAGLKIGVQGIDNHRYRSLAQRFGRRGRGCLRLTQHKDTGCIEAANMQTPRQELAGRPARVEAGHIQPHTLGVDHLQARNGEVAEQVSRKALDMQSANRSHRKPVKRLNDHPPPPVGQNRQPNAANSRRDQHDETEGQHQHLPQPPLSLGGEFGRT